MEQKIDEILRMDPTLIDARLRTMLYKIPEERALLILNDFQKALIANRDTIRNPVAYLMGMAQRVLSARDLPENSKVQRELDRLFRQGRITPSDIDERCRDMLKHLPEDKAIDALHELGATDVSTLHNIAAFFMGIMKKHSKIPRTTQQSQSDSFRNKLDLYSSNNRQGVNPSHSTNINSNSHYSRSHSHPPQLLPPPRIMPSELMYGYGEQEYFPEMPKAINLSFLPISVQEQLHNLIDRGILVVDDLDERVLSELKSFSEDHLLAITKEFSSLDRNSVRNVPSYLLGISRKVPAPYAPSKNISIEERFPTKRPLDYYDDMERERGRNNYSHSSSHSSHTHPIHGHPSTSSHSSIIDRDRERDRDRDYRERDRYPSHTHSHQSQPPSSLQQQQHHHHHPPPPTSTSRYPSSGPSTNSYYPSSTSNSSSRDEQIRRGGNNMIGNNGINNNNNNNSGIGIGGTGGGGGGRDYDDRNVYDERGMDDHRSYNNRDSHHLQPSPQSSSSASSSTTSSYNIRPSSEISSRNRVDMEIARNVAAGVIRDEDIDDRVRDYLAAQAPWVASKAICDFCAKDMSKINNKSNFLKGIVRKIVEKEAEIASNAHSGSHNISHSNSGYNPQHPPSPLPSSIPGPNRLNVSGNSSGGGGSGGGGGDYNHNGGGGGGSNGGNIGMGRGHY